MAALLVLSCSTHLFLGLQRTIEPELQLLLVSELQRSPEPMLQLMFLLSCSNLLSLSCNSS